MAAHKGFRHPSLDEIHGHEYLQKTLWDCEGHVEQAAAKIGCAYSALYNYLDVFPEAKELRKQAKLYFRKKRIEKLEDKFMEIDSKKNTLPASLPAIKYYLDTHGREEGWGQLEQEDSKTTINISCKEIPKAKNGQKNGKGDSANAHS